MKILAQAAAAFACLALVACGPSTEARGEESAPAPTPRSAATAEAVFAGGCFWSMEKAMEHAPGVAEAISGYTGGHVRNPSYQDVITETTGHYESVRVLYDPSRTSYRELADYFLHHIDPTDDRGQICDRGPSYRTAIFVSNAAERQAAEAAIAEAETELAREVVTQILPRQQFYDAEAYHQDFAARNPQRYERYRQGCGRDRRLAQVWGGR